MISFPQLSATCPGIIQPAEMQFLSAMMYAGEHRARIFIIYSLCSIPLLVAKLSIDSSDIISRKEIPLDGGPNISDQFYSYVAGIIFYNCCELFNFFFISFDAPSEYHCSSRIFVLFPVIVANSVSSISFPDIVIIFVYREIVDGVNDTLSIVDQFRPVFENIYRNIIEIYNSHFFFNYWKLLPLKNSRIKSKFRARMDQSDTHFFNT